MTTLSKCPQCGADTPVSAPAALCPRCLAAGGGQPTPSSTRWPRTHRVVGGIAAGVVWLMVVVTTAVITFVLPKSYVSTVRVRLEADPAAQQNPQLVWTQFQAVASKAVLEPVVERLNLSQRWNDRLRLSSPLGTEDTRQLLRRHMALLAVRTNFFADLRVESPVANEAAEIANAIAESWCSNRSATLTATGQIVKFAHPASTPARPNMALNLLVGCLGGTLAGLMAGALVLLVLAKSDRSGVPHTGRRKPVQLNSFFSPLFRGCVDFTPRAATGLGSSVRVSRCAPLPHPRATPPLRMFPRTSLASIPGRSALGRG